MNSQEKIARAAQADLVLLTVDMLRPPGALGESKSLKPQWCALESQALEALLHAANLSTSQRLTEALNEVFARVGELDFERWSDEYWRLFDSSLACPIHEAAYIRRDKGTILGDVSGFYRAFGWRLDVERAERPDHLLCELEFVAVLLAMASQASNSDEREVVASALAQFVRLHVHDWLPSVCLQMCDATQLAYFGAVANWLLLLWEALTDYHAWPIDARPAERSSPIEEPDNPYECAAPDLVQLSDTQRGRPVVRSAASAPL